MIYWCHMHSNEDVNMLESYHRIPWRSTMNRAAYNLQRHLPLSNHLRFPTPLHLTKPRTTKSPSANAHKGEPVKTFPTFRQRPQESAPNTLPISPQDLIKMTSNIAWTNSCNPCTLAEKHRSQITTVKVFPTRNDCSPHPRADIKLDQDEAHSKEYWNSNHCNHSSLVKAWTQAPLSAQWQKRCWQCWAAWSCSPVRGLKYLSCLLRSV